MTPRAAGLGLLGLLALGGCGSEPEDTGAHAVIGPQGGTLTVDSPGSPIDGVAVEIPVGALAREANVALRVVRDGSDLPDLPSGLAAFEPIVELASDVPFDRDVRLVFPLPSAGRQVDRIPSGFRADFAGAAWQVALADRLDDGSFAVRTRAVGTWRWGVTLVDEVDYGTLRPALVSVYGESEVGHMEAAGREQFDALVQDLPADEDAWTQCDTIDLIVEVIASVRADEARDIEETIAGVCGGCDVTAGVFVDELLDYLEARVKHWLYDLLIEAASPNFVIEILAKMAAYGYYQSILDGLTCDYECLAQESPPGLWGHAGAYLVCDVALAFIAFGVQFTECPPVEL